jgi:hypothetical protein
LSRRLRRIETRLRRIETRLRRIETRLRRIETRLRRTPALRAGASVEIDLQPAAGCEHVDFDTAAYSINVLTPSG